jgi:hypothetical protein
MDPLHVCIALGPLAMYLLVLGAVNLSRRPVVASGGRDALALALAISGFVAAGPMELFLPEMVAAWWGGWVWALMLTGYLLVVLFIVLMMRPRIVIYNCTRTNCAGRWPTWSRDLIRVPCGLATAFTWPRLAWS